ncbi:MAG: pyridoxal phosphate-dependent aminotransferase [Corynebacterium sp.]|nr:pyridoxal phosphate-dependent aminotransferase [Corynebacterium sp.]
MGEPDFETPPEIVNAAIQALHEGETHYADQQGLPELRQRIIQYECSGNSQLKLTPEQVLVTQGATAALSALILSQIGPGDRVVIPQPAYSLYADLVTLAGGEVDFIKLADDLHFDFDEIRSHISGAKMVIFSNPSNPNGIVHSRAELEGLIELVRDTETLLVCDEAYSSLVYGQKSFTSILSLSGSNQNIVYIQTFSKKFAMTGWRIGYLIANQSVTNAAALFHRTVNGSLNTAVQYAALQALDLEESTVESMAKEYSERRNIVVEKLHKVPNIKLIEPEGAFYTFIRYYSDKPSVEVVQDLAELGVVTRAGSEYGPDGEHHIRLSFSTAEQDLVRGLSIVAEYFTRMNTEKGDD